MNASTANWFHGSTETDTEVDALIVTVLDETVPEDIRKETMLKIAKLFSDLNFWARYITEQFLSTIDCDASFKNMSVFMTIVKTACSTNPERIESCMSVLLQLAQHKQTCIAKCAMEAINALYPIGILWILDYSSPTGAAASLWLKLSEIKAVVYAVVESPTSYSATFRLMIYKVTETIVVTQSPRSIDGWSFPLQSSGFREGVVCAKLFQEESTKLFGCIVQLMFSTEMLISERTAILGCFFGILKTRWMIYPSPFVPIVELLDSIRENFEPRQVRSLEKYILMGVSSVIRITGSRELSKQVAKWIVSLKAAVDLPSPKIIATAVGELKLDMESKRKRPASGRSDSRPKIQWTHFNTKDNVGVPERVIDSKNLFSDASSAPLWNGDPRQKQKILHGVAPQIQIQTQKHDTATLTTTNSEPVVPPPTATYIPLPIYRGAFHENVGPKEDVDFVRTVTCLQESETVVESLTGRRNSPLLPDPKCSIDADIMPELDRARSEPNTGTSQRGLKMRFIPNRPRKGHPYRNFGGSSGPSRSPLTTPPKSSAQFREYPISGPGSYTARTPRSDPARRSIKAHSDQPPQIDKMVARFDPSRLTTFLDDRTSKSPNRPRDPPRHLTEVATRFDRSYTKTHETTRIFPSQPRSSDHGLRSHRQVKAGYHHHRSDNRHSRTKGAHEPSQDSTTATPRIPVYLRLG